MGALHAGHAHLIERCRRECDAAVVSIFVNAMQFNVTDDFAKYPRTFEDDVALCESRGVDVVYAPTSDDMYPSGYETTVVPGRTADNLEGGGRPGHFVGVATVVTKLFNAVMPTHAYFGQKDFQQLAVITRLVRDLDMPVTVVPVPTVRDVDGLALSSRNARLSPDDRRAAPVIYDSLLAGLDAFRHGERATSSIRTRVNEVIAREPRARLEYVEVADAITCELIPSVDREAVLSVAAWFGDVRLIDNIPLTP